jgi:hypothetical protein
MPAAPILLENSTVTYFPDASKRIMRYGVGISGIDLIDLAAISGPL